MRAISADYIYPISSDPIKNGVVFIDDEGTILKIGSISEFGISISELENNQTEIEYYKGIICPGFINTHCHLELSHLHSQISEKAGIAGFIKEIVSKRTNFSAALIEQAIEDAEAEMIKNGIVAVGDVSNNLNTFKQKGKGNLLYHTFIEVFDLYAGKADELFEHALGLKKNLQNFENFNLRLPASIVPHSPYTVSKKMLELINKHALENGDILCVHNQESAEENQLFISKSGLLYDALNKMGVAISSIEKTGLNSLQSTLPLLKNFSKLLLVHNTFTTLDDIRFAKKQIEKNTSKVNRIRIEEIKNGDADISICGDQISNLYWCTCPNANLYIENKLPNYNNFIKENVCVTIGTDSLASNWSLSVLDELKTISKYFPEIPLQTLLLWATKNGANYLGFRHLGVIEKGKKPGLNLLKNISELKISMNTEMQKLV